MEFKERISIPLAKKKIKIGMPDLQKKERKGHYRYKTESHQRQTQKQQFDKLLDITARCVDYYNKFTDEKSSELSIVGSAFTEIHSNLDMAFNGIIEEVKSKHNEIKQFLMSKETELKDIKQKQEDCLKQTLEEVKSVHLKNLLQDYQPGDCELSVQLSSYASTLHKFYSVIEDIEKLNFKDSVDECINFINNLITQEIRIIVCERIPQKSMNCSFSFNDERLFESNAHKLFESNSHAKNKQPQQILQIIQNQQCRKQKIDKYVFYLQQ